MRSEKCVQQEVRLTEQELPAAPGALSAPRIDEGETLSKMIPASAGCVIDFFEARERLREALKGSSESEINREVRKVLARRLRTSKGGNRLEESIYLLLAAAVLFYLLLGLIGG